MFRAYFCNREWLAWSWGGTSLICGSIWFQVHLDVKINAWMGRFYDFVQKALTKPGAVSESDFNGFILSFARIAGVYIFVSVMTDFFTRHWTFRWRTALNTFYMQNWPRLRHIEGASQRVQEDSQRFADILEQLGADFLKAILNLVSFLPILSRLSDFVGRLPLVGKVPHSLVWLSMLWAFLGTVGVGLVGIRLPDLEFKNQLVEAAYRKELVFGEDSEYHAGPEIVRQLFAAVRKNYFVLFLNFMYFDVTKWSYLQFSVVVPYLALGLTICDAAISLGQMQRIVSAFGNVERSFQYLVRSWKVIIEFLSIYKRLNQFMAHIDDKKGSDNECESSCEESSIHIQGSA